MNKHKFMAWYIPKKEMVQSDHLESINFETKTLGVYMPIGNTVFHKLRMSDFNLMRYAGLEDFKGAEIYEDFIIDWQGIKYKVCIGEFGVRNFETEEIVDYVYGVYGSAINEEMEPFCFDIQINTVWIKQYEIEVIGNMYEHPHLLAGEQT